MFCKGLIQLRKSALPLALATVILAGTSVALTSTTAGASTSASSSSGVWPGVGKICEPGSGGASTVRGVGTKTINIAVFNDASNTMTRASRPSSPSRPQRLPTGATPPGASTGARS